MPHRRPTNLQSLEFLTFTGAQELSDLGLGTLKVGISPFDFKMKRKLAKRYFDPNRFAVSKL